MPGRIDPRPWATAMLAMLVATGPAYGREEGAAPVIVVERPPPAGGVTIGPDASDASVTASRAADALGAAVDISGPAPALLAGGGRGGRARLTSGFGLRVHPVYGTRRVHAGVDLAARSGALVIASTAGVVAQAGWLGGYGLCVTIDHGGGMQTRYGHLSRLGVAAGQRVRAGQVIGLVGSTGVSTGPHLHYEVRARGVPVNPLPRGNR